MHISKGYQRDRVIYRLKSGEIKANKQGKARAVACFFCSSRLNSMSSDSLPEHDPSLVTECLLCQLPCVTGTQQLTLASLLLKGHKVHQIPEVSVGADGSSGQEGQEILNRTAGETCWHVLCLLLKLYTKISTDKENLKKKTKNFLCLSGKCSQSVPKQLSLLL